MLPVCAPRVGGSSHPALASPRPQTGIHSVLQGWRAGPHLAHGDWVPARLGEETEGGSSDSKHSLYYVFDPEEKLSAGEGGGAGGEGPPCLGGPPTGHHPLWEPSHALQAPQKSTRAVPLGRRDGEGGREGRRERGSPWSEPEPEPTEPAVRAWSRRAEVG